MSDFSASLGPAAFFATRGFWVGFFPTGRVPAFFRFGPAASESGVSFGGDPDLPSAADTFAGGGRLTPAWRPGDFSTMPDTRMANAPVGAVSGQFRGLCGKLWPRKPFYAKFNGFHGDSRPEMPLSGSDPANRQAGGQ